MAKLVLSDLVNLQNESSAVNTINNNSALIEAAIEDTLSRSGTSPNEMNANLDMNANRILNLPLPVADTEPVRKGEFDSVFGDLEALEQQLEQQLSDHTQDLITNELDSVVAEAEGARDAAVIAKDAAELAQTNAETAETNAENSAIAAAQSAAEAAISADNFDDVYLGSKSSDPSLDNDGDPLVEGQLYWNNVGNNLRIYDGAAWQAYSASSGMTALVDDTTPALGGNLDLNGHVITGLEIGTDVQAYSANLGSWSAVIPGDYLTTSAAAAGYQPLASKLTDIAALAATDSNIIVGNGTTWVAESGSTARASLGIGVLREVLTANRTYYVRTDGSDSNDGLTDSSGGAFLTIQAAIDTSAALDLSIFDVTIQVRSGTYTDPIVLKSTVGAGTVFIKGDLATPSNVVISTTGNTAISGDGVLGTYVIAGVKIQTSTSGNCILIQNGTRLSITTVDFGSCAESHMVVTSSSVLSLTGSYTISGSVGASGRHIGLFQSACVQVQGSITVTLTGTPSFQYFALIDRLSMGQLSGITFSGSATGTRYSVSANAVCYTNGGGASYFPGNAAGGVANGGLYL